MASPTCPPSPTGTLSPIQVHSPALPDPTLPIPNIGCSLFYDSNAKTTVSVPSFFKQLEAFKATEDWPIHWTMINKRMYELEEMEISEKNSIRKDLLYYYKKWHHARSEPPKLYPSRKDWLKQKPGIQESFKALLTFDMVSGYDLDKSLLTKYFPNEKRLKEFLTLIDDSYPIKPEVPCFPKPYWSTPITFRRTGLSLDDAGATALLIGLQAEAWIFELMCYNNYHLSPETFRYQRDKILFMKKPFWEETANLPTIEEQPESPATPQIPADPTAQPYDPNIFTPVTPFMDYQLLRRTTASKLTAPSFQQTNYPGVDHLFKGKMRDSIFRGATMPSYSPWDMTLQGPQADPDTTYGSATIMRDLPLHPSRQTPIVKPPIISTASIQPTPRDFYVSKSNSLDPCSLFRKFSRRIIF